MTSAVLSMPTQRPVNPCFSSGPCAKRPGWSLDGLKDAFLARSHRTPGGKARLGAVIDMHRAILGIPDGYRVAIVPASDTGAVEMALWSLLGARGVDALGWEVFGLDWIKDITTQLKLDDVRVMKAPFGSVPDLSAVDGARDIVFTWNGTTGGARVPNGDWIPANRAGLTICDATSAVFAYDLPWDKLDVTTWSWQKVLGGEAAHGMLVLSPRAVDRLLNFVPDRPLPKIFRMVNNGKLIEGLFSGETLNTPSMLAVEDCLDALAWVESIGGLPTMMARVEANYKTVADWEKNCLWAEFLASDEQYRSKTSVCLAITDPVFAALDDSAKADFVKSMAKLLETDKIAYDIAGHRDAPAGLRIWCGGTVEQSDIAALLPWLDWAFAQSCAALK